MSNTYEESTYWCLHFAHIDSVAKFLRESLINDEMIIALFQESISPVSYEKPTLVSRMLIEKLPWEVQSNILNVLAHQVSLHYLGMHSRTIDNIKYFLERYSKTKIAQIHSLFVTPLINSILNYFPSKKIESKIQSKLTIICFLQKVQQIQSDLYKNILQKLNDSEKIPCQVSPPEVSDSMIIEDQLDSQKEEEIDIQFENSSQMQLENSSQSTSESVIPIFSPAKMQKPVKEQPNKGIPSVDSEIMKRSMEVKEKLQRSLQSKQKEIPQDLISLLQDLEPIMNILQLGNLDDDLVISLFHHPFISELSYQRCTTLLKGSLYPKVFHTKKSRDIQISSLQGAASRVLFSAIIKVAKSHPKPIVHGLLLPLVADKKSGSSQCEVVNRVVKECLPPEISLVFLRSILNLQNDSNETEDSAFSSSQHESSPFQWNEQTLIIIQNILNHKLELSSDDIATLVKRFEENVDSFINSAKFSTVAFQFISKYKSQLQLQVESLKRTLNKCTSFMTKAALRALDEITK